jgi:hypothetical protein
VSFSSGIDAVLTFSNFQSSSTYPAGYIGALSCGGLALGPANNHVDIDFTPYGFMALEGSVTGGVSRMVFTPIIAASGQVQLSYNGAEVDAYYNIGAGWQSLASFFPGWTGPVPVALPGLDILNGITSFTVNSVSVSGSGVPTPLPSALLLLGPGLAGLAAIRRKVKK